MAEKLQIHKAATKILAGLKQQNYSHHTIGRYRQCYDSLLKYTRERGIKDYSTSIGLIPGRDKNEADKLSFN